MLADSLDAFRSCAEITDVLVVTGDERAERLAADLGIEVVPGGPDEGQSAAAVIGIERALKIGTERVALLPGDCPLVDPGEVDELLRTWKAPVVIVPDRHGTGTNGLVLRPPDAIEPSFGPDSCARHAAHARAAGHEPEIVAVPSLGLDLDTPDDLGALREALGSDPSRAPSTRQVLA
jgi:2-phospho-L-lactate guanylyltransferase